MNPNPVIFLMGPTACGKTDLAAALFDLRVGGREVELISVDAAQVYRGMDIGTAKPPRDFLRRYPHHLIDIRAPNRVYSAAEFRCDALALIAQIHARGKLPVLVGGSMFYFSALENGLSDLPSADPESRAQIAREIEQYGLPAMHARLRQIDAKLAAAISPSDTQRIQRAMEIHRLTARPPSEVMRRSATQPLPFPLIKLALFTADRRALHRRIETRFRRMLECGLLDEVKTIAAALANADEATSMRTVGYRQALGFLRNEFAYDEMIAKATAATRQLAKRQFTWLRRQRNLVWVDGGGGVPTDSVRAYLQSRIEG